MERKKEEGRWRRRETYSDNPTRLCNLRLTQFLRCSVGIPCCGPTGVFVASQAGDCGDDVGEGGEG